MVLTIISDVSIFIPNQIKTGFQTKKQRYNKIINTYNMYNNYNTVHNRRISPIEEEQTKKEVVIIFFILTSTLPWNAV